MKQQRKEVKPGDCRKGFISHVAMLLPAHERGVVVNI